MTWLNKIDCERLKQIVHNSSTMYIVSKTDGAILWASPSFCNWSRYTLSELVNMTWMEISVNDDDLAADLENVQQLNEYNLSYTIQKRYIPKNDKPQIGNLQVTRYPATGPIEFCVCVWEPLKNGTAQAFELALDSHKKMVEKMTELTTKLETLTNRSEEENAFVALVRMGVKYPKVSLGILIIIFTMGGFDTVLGTLQKLGYIPTPPISVKAEDK